MDCTQPLNTGGTEIDQKVAFVAQVWMRSKKEQIGGFMSHVPEGMGEEVCQRCGM